MFYKLNDTNGKHEEEVDTEKQLPPQLMLPIRQQ